MAQQKRFTWLREGEEIILFERRHPLILLKWLIPPLLLLVAFGLAAWLLTRELEWSPAATFLIWLIALLPGMGWAIWRIFDWENDHYILTNQRVLHIEKVYFFYESRIEATLDRVQDVRVRMPGLMANLFYYGDVVIETAAAVGCIVFSAIPKPRKVQRLIFQWARLPMERLEERRREAERWEPERARWQQPLQVLYRMFFAVVPPGDETIIWRKHWWILFTELVGPVTLLIILLAIIVLWTQFELPAVGQYVWLVGVIFTLLWIVWRTIDWRNDLYILTPDRVIDIEKRPFILEDRLEASLGMIQDVGYTQPGFIRMTLDFGNVYLETAGELGRLTFDNVPNPRQVQREIMRRVRDFRAAAQRREEERQRQQLQQMIRDILQEGSDHRFTARQP